MKTLIVALALTVTTAAKATDWGDFTVKVSLAQTIAVFVNQTLMASTNVSSNRGQKVAVQIQNDVQDYNQTGAVTPFLEGQIHAVQNINSELSEQESVDVLLLASDELLK